VFVRVLGSAVGGHEPRVPEKVGVLEHGLKRAILAVSPPGMRPSERAFLGGLVLSVRRACVPVPDRRRAVGVQRGIAARGDSAVVGVEL
jgi:hypothetical protein